MKKVIALLLAACLALSASGMALAADVDPISPAEPVADVVDSGKVQAEQPTVPNDSTLYTAASFELPDSFQTPRSVAGNYFGNKLNDVQKTLYHAILAYFYEVDDPNHNGKVDISKSTITDDNSVAGPNSGNQLVGEGYIDGATPEDGYAALLAAIKDHPTDLYWVAKGSGNTHSFVVGKTANGNTVVYAYFAVIESYKLSSDSGTQDTYTIDGADVTYTYYTVNTEKGEGNGDALAAKNKASDIVKAAKDKYNDYEKIKYFNDEICKLTEYDSAAGDTYGESSEMINVFMGKSAVSEGYAKAFKYLCDLANIGCYLIEGSIEKDGTKVNHMWNLVQLDDFKWYLVDVTNNDGDTPTRERLAIGSKNALSAEYSLTLSDGTEPLNPDVYWSEKDFKPAPTPDNPESLTLNMTCPGGLITFDVRNPDGTPYSYFEGTYKLQPADITVTNSVSGEEFHPSIKLQDITSSARFEWAYLFDPRIPEGKYTVSVKNDPCYNVTITPNTFEFKDTDVYPRITFGKPDADGKVQLTIAASQENGEVHYKINNAPWGKVPTPFVTTISATEPDPYPTKWIEAYATCEGFKTAAMEVKPYNFAPASNAFQLVVDPVKDLKGPIKQGRKVLMATLSTSNASGAVSYEIDGTRCGGFQIEGDKVYSKSEFAASNYYPIFIKATDSQGKVAYGNARIIIESGGGDDGGDSGDGGDGDGTGGGNTGGGNSGSSGSNSSGGSVLGGGSATGGGTSSSTVSSETAAKDTAKAVKEAIANALKNHMDSAKASVSYKNKKSVSSAALKAMVKAAQKAAKDKGVKVDLELQSDVVKKGKVESRLTIDPAKATLPTDIKLGVKLENKVLADKFTEAFKTPVATISFEQTGRFGMDVGVAVKLDLSDLDTSTLTFFNYDSKTNTYSQLPTPAYYVDTAGYLHFTTNTGNNLVITDKPLPSE